MTDTILRDYISYLHLEDAVQRYPSVRPAMNAAETALIEKIMSMGGTAHCEGLTLRVHHCHMAGRHTGSWITATGDHPTRIRSPHHAQDYKHVWRRTINLDIFKRVPRLP